MKIGLMQRVLAGYRVPFFDMLAKTYDGQLTVFAGNSRPEEMIDGSKQPEVAKLWKAHNRYLFNGRAGICLQTDVMQWLDEWNPDVLIMEANQRYLLSQYAARWMHRRGRPVIGWGLGTGKTGGILLQRFLSNFDALITYSITGAESYSTAGFPADNIFIACNAVSGRPQRPMPQRPANYINDKPVVLFVGRLQARKRIDLLIKACAELRPEVAPELWIVGDGPVRAELTDQAMLLYPDTHFFGSLYGKELLSRFDNADLFVLPGTGGLAIQQAMASALPVVAAEADGTQADLVRSENGVLINPGDLADLTQTLDVLLSDPIKLRGMGEASFRIVDEEINLEAMVRVFKKAIDSTLESRLHR